MNMPELCTYKHLDIRVIVHMQYTPKVAYGGVVI